jgi:hypothetical protein
MVASVLESQNRGASRGRSDGAGKMTLEEDQLCFFDHAFFDSGNDPFSSDF